MKGLLLKDIYMAVKYCRAYLLVAIVFLAVSVLGSGNQFFMMYPMLLSSMIPVTLFAYDEKSRWNIYSQTLPYSRAQYVSGKYFIALAAVLAAWLLCFGAQCLRMKYTGTGSWAATLSFLLILFLVGIVAPALSLPIILKFGSEKGRIVYYVVIIIAAASSSVLSMMRGKISFAISLPAFYGLISAVGIAVFAISWLISIQIYKRRDL